MRHIIILISLLIATVWSATSNPVDPATAKKAATNLLQSAGMKKSDISLANITEATGFSHMYIFSVNGDKGFVVIAGDDNSEPVIAFSLDNPFPQEEMPAHVKTWFENYDKVVAYNSTTSKSGNATKEWRSLLEGKSSAGSKEIISPLIATQWDQSPYYNQLCPLDSSSGMRPPCGCTATATAQIMKYFQHPQTGWGSESYVHNIYGTQQADYGSTTYDWSNMPTKLNANSSTEAVHAVAELIYHIGVAVHMSYGMGGSAGKTASYGYGGDPSSENAFKYNFRYSPYVWTAFRDDYGDDDWHDLILNEITNGRPVLYAGYDEIQSGHAFVIDGYNTVNKGFHINWGWGGSYDGYFKIIKLNPGPPNQKYNFNLFATATIGIEPYPQFDPSSTTTVTAVAEPRWGASSCDCAVTGSGTYNFGDTIKMTARALNEHTRFVQWSDGCRYNPRITVATGGELTFTAQFAPLHVDTIGYYTTNVSMNRAINVPYGLGQDSVWGIKIPPMALKPHHDLTAVRYMGRKPATHTLQIFAGTDTPDEELYSATFLDTLPYDYTWYTHTLLSPIAVNCNKALWIVLRCNEIDTPAVFSLYGGNPYGILSGESLTPMDDTWKFSWMIDAIFAGDGTGVDAVPSDYSEINLFPNPATDQVTLSGLKSNAVVEFIDVNGRVCKTLTLSADGGNETVINISDLKSGAYLVHITSVNTHTIKKFLIK